VSDETGEAIDARARLVAWAEGEVGLQDPAKYYAICAPQFLGTKPNEKSWCGIFVLAGLRTLELCDWDWSTRRTEPGFVYRLRPIAFPDVGDIAVFQKSADGVRDLWHHAIVRRPPIGGLVDTVDGNVLWAPAEGVALKTHRIRSALGDRFYSIAGLLADRAGATVKV